jgi:hypothetical protein
VQGHGSRRHRDEEGKKEICERDRDGLRGLSGALKDMLVCNFFLGSQFGRRKMGRVSRELQDRTCVDLFGFCFCRWA